MLLSSIINDVWSNPPFLLIQSSAAQSSLSIFRQVLARNLEVSQANHTLLFCFVHPPSSLLRESEVFPHNLQVHDWTCMAPGYEADWKDPRAIIHSIVKTGMSHQFSSALSVDNLVFSAVGPITCRVRLNRHFTVRHRVFIGNLCLPL